MAARVAGTGGAYSAKYRQLEAYRRQQVEEVARARLLADQAARERSVHEETRRRKRMFEEREARRREEEERQREAVLQQRRRDRDVQTLAVRRAMESARRRRSRSGSAQPNNAHTPGSSTPRRAMPAQTARTPSDDASLYDDDSLEDSPEEKRPYRVVRAQQVEVEAVPAPIPKPQPPPVRPIRPARVNESFSDESPYDSLDESENDGASRRVALLRPREQVAQPSVEKGDGTKRPGPPGVVASERRDGPEGAGSSSEMDAANDSIPRRSRIPVPVSAGKAPRHAQPHAQPQPPAEQPRDDGSGDDGDADEWEMESVTPLRTQSKRYPPAVAMEIVLSNTFGGRHAVFPAVAAPAQPPANPPRPPLPPGAGELRATRFPSISRGVTLTAAPVGQGPSAPSPSHRVRENALLAKCRELQQTRRRPSVFDTSDEETPDITHITEAELRVMESIAKLDLRLLRR